MTIKYFDGLLLKTIRYLPSLGITQVKTEQPSTDLIAAENAQIRNSGGARALGFGACLLRIPVNELEALERANPELKSPDAGIKTRAWQKFTRSIASKPWRVTAGGKV